MSKKPKPLPRLEGGRPPLEQPLPHDAQIALAKMLVLMARGDPPQVSDAPAGRVMDSMALEVLGAIESQRKGLAALEGPVSRQARLKILNDALQDRSAALEAESKRQSKRASATRKKIPDGLDGNGQPKTKTLTYQDLMDHQESWLLKPGRTIFGWKAAAKRKFKITTVPLNRILREGTKPVK
jgi:hypothetical protein